MCSRSSRTIEPLKELERKVASLSSQSAAAIVKPMAEEFGTNAGGHSRAEADSPYHVATHEPELIYPAISAKLVDCQDIQTDDHDNPRRYTQNPSSRQALTGRSQRD